MQVGSELSLYFYPFLSNPLISFLQILIRRENLWTPVPCSQPLLTTTNNYYRWWKDLVCSLRRNALNSSAGTDDNGLRDALRPSGVPPPGSAAHWTRVASRLELPEQPGAAMKHRSVEGCVSL